MLPTFPYPTRETGLLGEKLYSGPGAGNVQDKPEIACHTVSKDTLLGFTSWVSRAVVNWSEDM